MSLDERARSAGLGTVQVFQESTDVATEFGRLVARRRSQRRSRVGAVAVVVAVVLVVFAVQGSFSNAVFPEPMDGQVPQGPFDWVSTRGTTVEIRDATSSWDFVPTPLPTMPSRYGS